MGKKFSAEEQAELLKNPYVKNVYDSKLCMTAKFKEEFWPRYQSGESPTRILRSMGFSLEALGETRCWSIAHKLKKELARKGSFSDVRSTKTMGLENKNDEWTRHELAYLRQEVEFIKKTILLERETLRKCSSKKTSEPNTD